MTIFTALKALCCRALLTLLATRDCSLRGSTKIMHNTLDVRAFSPEGSVNNEQRIWVRQEKQSTCCFPQSPEPSWWLLACLCPHQASMTSPTSSAWPVAHHGQVEIRWYRRSWGVSISRDVTDMIDDWMAYRFVFSEYCRHELKSWLQTSLCQFGASIPSTTSMKALNTSFPTSPWADAMARLLSPLYPWTPQSAAAAPSCWCAPALPHGFLEGHFCLRFLAVAPCHAALRQGRTSGKATPWVASFSADSSYFSNPPSVPVLESADQKTSFEDPDIFLAFSCPLTKSM